MDELTQDNSGSLMETAGNISKSPSFLSFLMMPLIGALTQSRKKSKKAPANQNVGDKEQKPLNLRVKNKDPQFSTVPTTELRPLKMNDSSADILGKMYNFMRSEHVKFVKNTIVDEKYRKKLHDISDSHTVELIELFSGNTKKTAPEPILEKPKEVKKPEQPKKREPVVKSEPNLTPSKPATQPVKPSTPTAERVPSASTVGKTAIGIGALGAAASVAAKISRGESLGASPESYTQANIPKGSSPKESQIVKGSIDVTTGQKFEKSLTEMTIPEVIALGKRRYSHFKEKGGSAMGKYQFIPGTLEESAKKLYGDEWKNKIFDEKTQEEINQSFIVGNAQRLKQANVPVTDASLYMMHFFGNPTQTSMVMSADDSQSMKPILDYYYNQGKQKAQPSEQNQSIAKMTVGQYKSYLRKKGFDFKTVDLTSSVPPINNKDVGSQIDSDSRMNRDLKKSGTNQQNNTTILNNKKTVVNGSNIYEQTDDKTYPSPFINRQYGQ